MNILDIIILICICKSSFNSRIKYKSLIVVFCFNSIFYLIKNYYISFKKQKSNGTFCSKGAVLFYLKQQNTPIIKFDYRGVVAL